MSLKGLSEKRRQKKYTFNMPDGSILYTCADVDRYYNLGKNMTRSRLSSGWTEEECVNNRRKNIEKKYTFNMPDGSVLYSCSGVDRFYNMKSGVTFQRLKRGWTEEECANNNKEGGQGNYTFNMPDGSVLYTCSAVDRYYNLKPSATSQRLNRGWTEEECANNNKEGGQRNYTFNMPDGSILYTCADVDRYYNLRKRTTWVRMSSGWTEEECANNKRDILPKYTFNMPDGSILHSCPDVDRYYDLGRGTTRSRLITGWTEEECANNKRPIVPEHIFHMPDGTIVYRKSHVDKYYNLSIGCTTQRLSRGWTEEECANNKRFK